MLLAQLSCKALYTFCKASPVGATAISEVVFGTAIMHAGLYTLSGHTTGHAICSVSHEETCVEQTTSSIRFMVEIFTCVGGR